MAVLTRLAVAAVLIAVAGSCATAPSDPQTSHPAAAASTPGEPESDEPDPATRLASHMFVPVGESRSLSGFGELLEVVTISGDNPLDVAGDSLTAAAPGAACLRFRYREMASENGIQTLCAVAFDETGDCSGLDPLHVDLGRYGPDNRPDVGESNLLAGGALFAACETPGGGLRLRRPDVELPDLYFVIVDALGDGPYSLGDAEMGAQRRGTVVTYDGDEIEAPWIVTVSREVSEITWSGDGGVVVNDEACADSPSCTVDSSVIQPGDVFRTSLGIGPDQIDELIASTDSDDLERFVGERIGVTVGEIASIHPDAAAQVYQRLVVVEVMGDLLSQWDDQYRLRDQQITIGYWQPWFVEQTITGSCLPGPTEQAACELVEAAVSAYEHDRIAAWRDSGFRLWQAGFLPTGNDESIDDRRPHWSAFEGVMAGIGGQDLVGVDLAATFDRAVRALADGLDPGAPVLLFLSGPPIEALTSGVFCEADVCLSDFAGSYEMAEATLTAALEAFTPDQLDGFGVALFEGSHFDIRHPIEEFGFPLNRVAETGYNQPILNVWRAQ